MSLQEWLPMQPNLCRRVEKVLQTVASNTMLGNFNASTVAFGYIDADEIIARYLDNAIAEVLPKAHNREVAEAFRRSLVPLLKEFKSFMGPITVEKHIDRPMLQLDAMFIEFLSTRGNDENRALWKRHVEFEARVWHSTATDLWREFEEKCEWTIDISDFDAWVLGATERQKKAYVEHMFCLLDLFRRWIEPERLSPLCRKAPPFLLVLARLVWLCEVQPRFATQKSPVPIVFTGINEEYRMMRGVIEGPLESVREQGKSYLKRTQIDGVVAFFLASDGEDLQTLRLKGIEDADKLIIEAIYRWVVREVRIRRLAGETHPQTISLAGFGDLARRIGVDPSRTSDVRAALETMQSYRGSRRDLPPLLSYSLPYNDDCLVIDVSSGLDPDAKLIAWLEKRALLDHNRQQKVKLPVFELPKLRGLGLAPRLFSALCDLQGSLLWAFKSRQLDLPRHEGWLLSEVLPEALDRTNQLQDRATKISIENANKVINAWFGTGPGEWLKDLGNGRVTLSDEGALKLFREAAEGAEAFGKKKRKNQTIGMGT